MKSEPWLCFLVEWVTWALLAASRQSEDCRAFHVAGSRTNAKCSLQREAKPWLASLMQPSSLTSTIFIFNNFSAPLSFPSPRTAAKSDKKTVHPKVVISPHAGYAYSGSTAAHAYGHIHPDKVKRLFILGPSHCFYTTTCHISSADAVETPLGNIKVDREVVTKLMKTGAFSSLSLAADEAEHSLELQYPYIAKIMRGREFSIVPIVVGSLSASDEMRFGKILSEFLNSDENMFVVSSDFCHWGSRFSYQPTSSAGKPIWEHISDLDTEAMRHITRLVRP